MTILLEQTIANLRQLRLAGMAQSIEDQRLSTSIQELSFDDRLGMAVDIEILERETRKLARLKNAAKLKIDACPENIKYQAKRGLDRHVMSNLYSCDFMENGLNVILTGSTGVGKTWIACSLGTQAVRKGYSVLYVRLSRLLEDLEIAHHDGSLPLLRKKLLKRDLLILDDWALAPMTEISRHELLEIIDDRVGKKSMVISTQVPVEDWHAWLGEATIADAILDRIVHRSHHIKLQGESLRKRDGAKALSLQKKAD